MSFVSSLQQTTLEDARPSVDDHLDVVCSVLHASAKVANTFLLCQNVSTAQNGSGARNSACSEIERNSGGIFGAVDQDKEPCMTAGRVQRSYFVACAASVLRTSLANVFEI
jgi:hypothetical protein